MNEDSPILPSLRSRLISGGIWALIGKIATAISSLLISGLLTRLLSPDDVGVYFLTLSLITVFSVAAQLGLNRAVVLLTAEAIASMEKEKIRPLLMRIFTIATICTLCLALLMATGTGNWIATVLFHSSAMANVINLAALWIISFTIQSLLAETFRGLHDIRMAVIFQSLLTNLILLSLLVFSWLIIQQATLSFILILTISSGVISILLGTFLLVNKLRALPPSLDSGLSVLDIMRIAWPLLVTSLMTLVMGQTSVWVLGMFRSHDEVALYGAAVRLIALVAMPLLITNAVLPPVITELFIQRKYLKMEQMLRTVATLTAVPALAVILFFIFFGGFTLDLVFGEYYTGASVILMILSIGHAANIIAGSCGLTLMMTGHQSVIMYITVFSGFLNLGLSLATVGPYGVIGVAFASATTLLIQNALMLIFTKREVGVWTHVTCSLAPFTKLIKS